MKCIYCKEQIESDEPNIYKKLNKQGSFQKLKMECKNIGMLMSNVTKKTRIRNLLGINILVVWRI